MMRLLPSTSMRSFAFQVSPSISRLVVEPAPEEESALQSSFKTQVRPLLDAVDKLRAQNITAEGISLPTIVVVGDQSSGKSSVLESLAQVALPSGRGMVTRVPLVLRLINSRSNGSISMITIQYGSVTKELHEDEITSAIQEATVVLSGDGVSNNRIQLNITKPDAPDLTMVDLPGITRVPINGQPEDIQQQIKDMIMEQISPKASIILNVMTASMDFTTSESILMSRQVDTDGERTLAVVTKCDKCDKSTEELVEKVKTDVLVGLGYICVRNRIGSESHEEARRREEELFGEDPHLKNLSKDMVGIPSLAKRLMDIQAESIKKCMPKLEKDIEQALRAKKEELSRLPRHPPSDVDSAQGLFLEIHQNLRRELEMLLTRLKGSDKRMNFTARLHEIIVEFQEKLSAAGETANSDSTLLESMLDESKGAALPDFRDFSVFKDIIAEALSNVREDCESVVSKGYEYALEVTFPIISRCTGGYSKLTSTYRKIMQTVLAECKLACDEFVQRKLEKERNVVFTYNSQYTETFNRERLMSLNAERHFASEPLEETRNSLKAYWKVVENRLADEIAMELRYSLHQAVAKKFDAQGSMLTLDMVKLMELLAEDPLIHLHRQRLVQSIDNLEKCDRILKDMCT